MNLKTFGKFLSFYDVKRKQSPGTAHGEKRERSSYRNMTPLAKPFLPRDKTFTPHGLG